MGSTCEVGLLRQSIFSRCSSVSRKSMFYVLIVLLIVLQTNKSTKSESLCLSILSSFFVPVWYLKCSCLGRRCESKIHNNQGEFGFSRNLPLSRRNSSKTLEQYSKSCGWPQLSKLLQPSCLVEELRSDGTTISVCLYTFLCWRLIFVWYRLSRFYLRNLS